MIDYARPGERRRDAARLAADVTILDSHAELLS